MSFEVEELEDIFLSIKQRISILNATEPDLLIKLLKGFEIQYKSSDNGKSVVNMKSCSEGMSWNEVEKIIHSNAAL